MVRHCPHDIGERRRVITESATVVRSARSERLVSAVVSEHYL
jgi:hypothetical protein